MIARALELLIVLLTAAGLLWLALIITLTVPATGGATNLLLIALLLTGVRALISTRKART